jgi:hypothetical protein
MIDFETSQNAPERPITWYVLRLPGYDYVDSFSDQDRALARLDMLKLSDKKTEYEVHGTTKSFVEMQKGLREGKELPSGHVF